MLPVLIATHIPGTDIQVDPGAITLSRETTISAGGTALIASAYPTFRRGDRQRSCNWRIGSHRQRLTAKK